MRNLATFVVAAFVGTAWRATPKTAAPPTPPPPAKKAPVTAPARTLARRFLMMIATMGGVLFAATGASAEPAMTPTPVQTGSWENARGIPRDAAIRMVDQGKAVFIDIRSFETYGKGHIRGAVSIPRS